MVESRNLYFYLYNSEDVIHLFKTAVAIVPDAKASYSGCGHASNVDSDGIVLLDENVPDDESICVSTSRGAWAVLKLSQTDSTSSNAVTFDEWLYNP